MPRAPLGTVLSHLRHLVEPERARELSDAQLLERFVSRHEESAFAALLQRHARLVWSVCRQVLLHEQDAEDAFQATFLALARHASSIREGQAVSSWLYHVAYRIALKAGADRSRRQARERQATSMTRAEPASQLAWRELQAVLDAELERLPEKYRAPFVLCCLEGKSKPEAAQVLGWKEGTVSGRLAQARKLLQERLARRGMMFSAALCAMTLAREAVAAPAALVGPTVRAAVLSATDQTAAAGLISAPVAALVEGVTRTMFVSKAKLATVLLLAVGLLAAGLGLLTHQALAARQTESAAAVKRSAPEQGKEAPAAAPAVRAAADPAKKGTEDAIVLKGRVLGPDGKPVPGAKVRFVNVDAESDKEGAYRVALPRPAGVKGPFTKDSQYWYHIAAVAEGYGVDFRPIGTADREGTLDLHLVKDDVPIEGRILDLEGRPVAGATVRVARLSATPDENLDVFLKAWKFGPAEALAGAEQWVPAPIMVGPGGAKPKEIARPKWRTWWGYWEWNPIKPVTTDKDGKFRLTGIGRERFVELTVSGPTIQQTGVKVVTRKGIDVKDLSKPDPDYLKQGPFIRPIILPFPPLYGPTFEHFVGPTKPVTGVVRDKATGKPLAGVRVLGRMSSRDISQIRDIETVTDEKGQYTLTGMAKADRYLLAAVAKDRSIYIPEGKDLNDTEGLKPLTADFDMARGVTVQGRLLDKATGKAMSGVVTYTLMPQNDRFADGRPGSLLGNLIQQRQFIGEGGEFQFTVCPGAGILFGQADDQRYLPLFVTPEDRKKGIFVPPDFTAAVHIQGHAYRLIDPAEGAQPLKFDLELLTGRTLTGTVVDPDGKPLAGVVGTLVREAQFFAPGSSGQSLSIDDDSGKFTVENVDPRVPPVLIFSHKEKNLALRLEVRGDEKGPLTARLRPGGKLTGRVLDVEGRPLANARINLLLGKKDGQFRQANTFLASGKTDREGRFTMEGILPETGLILLVGVFDQGEQGPGRTIHSIDDLTWEAGEAKDLKDIKTQFKTKPAGNE
jgi:RNA polymerase sigma factor (sigma-70 family)